MKLFNTLFFTLILSIVSFSQVVEGNLLSQWSDNTLPGSTAYDNTYNEVWGVSINGREIAIIGSTMGTHFIDVTDPIDITEVAFVKGGTVGPEIVHRDYHDLNGYLYAVADEGNASTLQIIDITTLPDSVTVMYDEPTMIRRAHNIFIDSSSSRLYALATSSPAGYASMRIFSIEDPLNPVMIKSFSSNLLGKSISHVHDAYVKNDTAYLNCGPSGFAICDFSDLENPVLISSLDNSDYPQAGYNHSGWATSDGKYYYMADEDWNHDIKVLELNNLPDISVPTFFDAGNDNIYSIPHNQIVHNELLFVSYYFDGLQVYDISNPIIPKRVMSYPTSQLAPIQNYKGAWGVYPFLPSGNILVSDMQEGLFVIEKFNKTSSNENAEFLSDIKIFPNIISNRFSIKGDLSNIESISLHSINGETCQSWKSLNDEYTINPKLISGMYFITIIKEGKNKRFKVVVNN